jgi:biotin transport system substrate-specific component
MNSQPKSQSMQTQQITQAWNVRGIVFSALFAALFIVLSLVNIKIGPVPFTLETFAVMLAGGLLGGRYGFTSIFVVIALTALGLPLLHGSGGFALMVGPTAGFIWMFSVSALLIGWCAERIRGNGWKDAVLMFLVMELFGSLLMYVSGVPWFMHATGLSLNESLPLAMVPFLLPDAAKAILAAGITISLRKYVPALRR